MFNINYFSILCLVWGGFGVITHILMIVFGERWNKWEMERAYKAEKPKWIYFAVILSLALIFYTWYKVATSNIEYSWIVAVLLTLTSLKAMKLIFDYNKFRQFATKVLNNAKLKLALNIAVISFSLILICMALFLY